MGSAREHERAIRKAEETEKLVVGSMVLPFVNADVSRRGFTEEYRLFKKLPGQVFPNPEG